MKKHSKLVLLALLFLSFLLTGCSVVRIDTDNIDTIVNVVFSKDNSLYNTVGRGYKYYKPRGVTSIDISEYNEELYSNGYYYYLYVDINSYYYKTDFTYEENETSYYSRYIDINGKTGYLEINEQSNGYYLIEFMYNYSKIEALVLEDDINKVVLDASYILSTIKYNSNVIKIVLNEDYFINKEEVYDIFSPKSDSGNFIVVEGEEGDE